MTTAEEAVHQFGRLVLDTAWRITRSSEDARDVHQETFLKFHEALCRKTHIENPKAWLYRTAFHAALKRLRQQRREEPLDDDACPTWERGELTQAEREQLARQVRERIGDLPPRQQEVCILRFYQGLGYDQIAHTLECAPGAARAAVFQALKTLREWLCEKSTTTRHAEGDQR